MNIALFGKYLARENISYFQILIDELTRHNVNIIIYKPFYETIKKLIRISGKVKLFENHKDLVNNTDFLFSIGGDGTLLDTITYVRDSGIPIMGINTGRLGFLANISKDNISKSLSDLFSGNYTLDKRSLIALESPKEIFGKENFALNELAIYKKDPLSMVSIEVTVNDIYLNTYLADGLIVATPTGSTAYSLSTGGPIISPDSKNFIINPIATHNLTVRPIIIPDDSIVKIKIKGEKKPYYISLDSRLVVTDTNMEIIAKKGKFKINLIKMNSENFYKTIRDKLLWGLDARI